MISCFDFSQWKVNILFGYKEATSWTDWETNSYCSAYYCEEKKEDKIITPLFVSAGEAAYDFTGITESNQSYSSIGIVYLRSKISISKTYNMKVVLKDTDKTIINTNVSGKNLVQFCSTTCRYTFYNKYTKSLVGHKVSLTVSPAIATSFTSYTGIVVSHRNVAEWSNVKETSWITPYTRSASIMSVYSRDGGTTWEECPEGVCPTE